jgi:type VII secretion protein EccB
MDRKPSDRLAASAQRFWTRRRVHALVRGDTVMDDEPVRAQSRALAGGCVLAVILIAGCAVLAVVKPRGVPGDAPIVVVRESGAVFVRVDDALHPVFNLASARLVARAAATPVVVAERSLETVKRGPRLGIPGAPDAIGVPLSDPAWQVCDTDRTVVTAGGRPPTFDTTRTVLVTPRGEGAASTYLLYDGVRARVDLRERAVARALHLDGVAPVVVSRALLDSLPEVPDVTVPRIAGAGTPGPMSIGGLPVGTVVRVARADTDEFHVVLADGLQRIGAVAADVIRIAYRGAGDIATVSPSDVAATATVETLAVNHFPRGTRIPVGAADRLAVCVHRPPADTEATVLTGDAKGLDESGAVTLAQADGDGPRVDAVAVPRGRCVYAHAVGVTGAVTSGGPRFLVTDTGAVYGVTDDDAARALGLPTVTTAAPWPVLAQLPAGPELGIAAASVARDVPTT